MSLFTGAALLGAGLAAATGTAVAAKVGSNAAARAGDLNAQAADKELAYLRQKDAQDQQNFEQTQNLNLGQYNQKEARLAPYRSIGAGATGTLADLIGAPMVQVPSGAAPPPGSSSSPGFTASSTPPVGGSTSSGGDPGDLISKGVQSLGLNARDPQATAKLAAYLKANGFPNAQPADHHGAPSIDKIDFGNGQSADIIIGSDGPNPTFGFQPYPTGGSATPASAASTPGFSVMPPSAAPTLASLYNRTAPLSAGY